MANKERGEFSFEAEGKTYTLQFTIDALCHLEDATGKGVVAITQEFADPEKIRLTTARAGLWAGLREHHPDVTLEKAGELIQQAGGMKIVIELVSQAVILAFSKANGKAGRPRMPAGTGLSS